MAGWRSDEAARRSRRPRRLDLLRRSADRRRNASAALEPSEAGPDAAGRERDAGVGAPVVHVDGVAVLAEGRTAGKGDVADIPETLVNRLGSEDPFLAARKAHF